MQSFPAEFPGGQLGPRLSASAVREMPFSPFEKNFARTLAFNKEPSKFSIGQAKEEVRLVLLRNVVAKNSCAICATDHSSTPVNCEFCAAYCCTRFAFTVHQLCTGQYLKSATFVLLATLAKAAAWAQTFPDVDPLLPLYPP